MRSSIGGGELGERRTALIRVFFKIEKDDCGPVKWPPPGPFWCIGSSVRYGEAGGIITDYSTVVAYVNTIRELREFWPDATDISVEWRNRISFSERFPVPEWWDVERNCVKEISY